MSLGERDDRNGGRENKHRARSRAMETLVAYGRGAAGALLVGLHLIFTMEMWWAGFSIPPGRVILLMVLNFGILLILQHFSGLHPRKTVASQTRAAVVAYGIGVLIA